METDDTKAKTLFDVLLTYEIASIHPIWYLLPVPTEWLADRAVNRTLKKYNRYLEHLKFRNETGNN